MMKECVWGLCILGCLTIALHLRLAQTRGRVTSCCFTSASLCVLATRRSGLCPAAPPSIRSQSYRKATLRSILSHPVCYTSIDHFSVFYLFLTLDCRVCGLQTYFELQDEIGLYWCHTWMFCPSYVETSAPPTWNNNKGRDWIIFNFSCTVPHSPDKKEEKKIKTKKHKKKINKKKAKRKRLLLFLLGFGLPPLSQPSCMALSQMTPSRIVPSSRPHVVHYMVSCLRFVPCFIASLGNPPWGCSCFCLCVLKKEKRVCCYCLR